MMLWTDIMFDPPITTAGASEIVCAAAAARGSGHAQNRDGEAVVFVAAVAVAGSASLLHSVTSTIYHATDLDGGKIERRTNLLWRGATYLALGKDATGSTPGLSYVTQDFQKDQGE